jgi:divalent metal cation (Fe/Co/Zn/Cd) transporter
MRAMMGLHLVALIAIAVDLCCAAWLAWAVIRRPPHMTVMALVWPLSGLFGGPLTVWLYRRYGEAHMKPFWASVAIDTCHCGSGCTLGDILAEILAAVAPGVLVWFGLGSLFRDPVPAGWVLDTVLAFVFGIYFQYAAIKPMHDISAGAALIRALKADTLSLAAWQAGMIGFMALMQYGMPGMAAMMSPATVEYWLMMQIAMLIGFVLSYPVNWWLVRAGIKDAM